MVADNLKWRGVYNEKDGITRDKKRIFRFF